MNHEGTNDSVNALIAMEVIKPYLTMKNQLIVISLLACALLFSAANTVSNLNKVDMKNKLVKNGMLQISQNESGIPLPQRKPVL